MGPLRFPDGRRFAFTIMDDTDVATVENVAPIYDLLAQLGFRTTKTVWPVGCPEGSKNFGTSQTLEDPEYLDFVLGLARRGFEIAYHGATMESSTRERTQRAIERFVAVIGHLPRVFANHAHNQENLYWGADRIDAAPIRALYGRLNGQPAGFYQGHIPGSPWWWGDLATEHVEYARNLTYDEIDVRQVNPTLPYRDPARSLVAWWFSACDAEDVRAFNHLLRRENQERLERLGGVAIVATHLGKGFCRDGKVHAETAKLIRELAGRAGWFVPVGVLLDWLRAAGANGPLPPQEWRRMQRRWFRDLIWRQVSQRIRRQWRRFRVSPP